MKMKMCLLAAVAFCVAGLMCVSQAAAETKIAVMNVPGVLSNCEAGKVAKKKVQDRMKELDAKFKAENESLVSLQKDIEKKRSAWSEQKLQQEIRAYQKKGNELKAKTEDARFELKQLEEKEFQPIVKAFEGVFKSYTEKNDIDLVFDLAKSGIVHFEKSMEISEELIKEMNTALK